MKTLSTILALILGTALLAQKSEQIVGIWKTEEGKSKIEVYKKNGHYHGKIKWVRDNVGEDGTSPKRDVNNPDPEKRNRPLVGTKIVKNLEWDAGDEEWNEGKIYDPESGKTYSVFARLESPEELYIKGFIGISLIGRSTIWTRVE